MAVTITPIDLGIVAGDGTGDTAREGGTKINANEANLKSAVETLQAASPPEGTEVLSTGEVGGTKFLREDGDNSCSWQTVAAGSGAFEADVDTQITPTTSIVLDHATNNEIALDIAYTTNKAAGNDTGLVVNQTDTASPGTSKAIDVQTGSVSKAYFDNNGQLLLDPAGAFGATTGVMFGDGDTGFAEVSDDVLYMYSGGAVRFVLESSGFRAAAHANAPRMTNAAATATIPSLLPAQSDADTGIGWAGADILNLIAGGVSGISVTEAAGAIAVDVTDSLTVDSVDVMTISSTDTLTNKTFDANGTGNSLSNVDVADLADGTDGELITWDTAGAPAVVAVGTVDHVLTSNGVGAAPTFQAAAAGGGGWDVEDQTNGNYGHGLNALDSITVGSGLDNVAIGENAGTAITTGDWNIAIGTNALDSCTTTSQSIAIGFNTLAAITTNADGNIGIGHQAGKALIASDNCVLIGTDAASLGAMSGTANGTVAIGNNALKVLGNAGYNVAIGWNALQAVTITQSNTAVGYSAGLATTGTANCFFGNRAGDATTTGSYNIVVGTGSISGLDTSGATASDEIVLGTALVGSMKSHTDVDMSGKSLALTGASAFATASTNLDGGDMVVEGGTAATTGIGVGGDLYLRGGTKGASGTTGLIMMDTIPTSDPSVAGALWSNSGVLTISAG